MTALAQRMTSARQAVLRQPRFVGGLLLVLVALYPVALGGETTARRFLYIALIGIAALSMNFTLGVAGQFAIGQAGLFAAGGYMAAILTVHAHWNFWLAILAGTLFAGVVGLIAATPGLRVGGWSFAMMSLLVAVAIPQVALLMPKLTGGEQGLAGLPVPSIGGHMLSINQLYLLVAACVAVLVVLLWRIRTSIYGLAFASMRNNPVGAQANGISTVSLRIGAYLLSSLMAGLAGGIYVHVDGFISTETFPLSLSIELIAAVVIGGLGTLAGPLIGAGILQYVPDLTTSFERYSLLIYGGILIVVMVLMPRGLTRTAGDGWRAVVAHVDRLRRRSAAAGEQRLEDWARTEHQFDPSGVPASPQQRALTVSGVSKAFGGVTALENVSLHASPGEITAVIGANGSGKTTLLNVVSGYYTVDAGTVRLGETTLTGLAPHRIARSGLSRTFQTPILMSERSVIENVICAAFQHRRASLPASVFHTPRSRRDLARLAEDARALLAALGMVGLAELETGVLPPGEQRLVELAMAIARYPSAILLDEPAAGLIGSEVEAMSSVLRALRERGYTILLIEHNVDMVMDLADHVVVLDRGTVIADGTPDAVRENRRVIDSYLGEISVVA